MEKTQALLIIKNVIEATFKAGIIQNVVDAENVLMAFKIIEQSIEDKK